MIITNKPLTFLFSLETMGSFMAVDVILPNEGAIDFYIADEDNKLEVKYCPENKYAEVSFIKNSSHMRNIYTGDFTIKVTSNTPLEES